MDDTAWAAQQLDDGTDPGIVKEQLLARGHNKLEANDILETAKHRAAQGETAATPVLLPGPQQFIDTLKIMLLLAAVILLIRSFVLLTAGLIEIAVALALARTIAKRTIMTHGVLISIGYLAWFGLGIIVYLILV